MFAQTHHGLRLVAFDGYAEDNAWICRFGRGLHVRSSYLRLPNPIHPYLGEELPLRLLFSNGKLSLLQ
jgi:hypothetical protein